MSATVLLADDDASLRFVLSQALSKEGYAVRATGAVQTLAKWVRDGEGDLVVSDVYMGEECVFDALPALRNARPELPVIVMSAQSTVATAMSAAGVGAYDYLPKPFDLDDLLATVKRALAGTKSRGRGAAALSSAREERLPLIGRSAAMQDVYRVMARVTTSDLTVLIEGEGGSGKRRVARAIHAFSRRKNAPFVALNLGAHAGDVDRALLDGALEQAQGGVLMLDGLDSLSGDDQTRLFGALQGLDGSDKHDVRMIATSQRPLAAMVRDGGFRQDLFYRLKVVQITLPPLRERKEDIGDLARAFLANGRKEGLPERLIAADAIEALKTHDWPGNVRELENLLKRIAALYPDPVMTAAQVRAELAAAPIAFKPEAPADSLDAAFERHLAGVFAGAGPNGPEPGLYDRCVEALERPLLEATLRATRGNQIKAAAILGINRNTLRKKIVTLGIAGAWLD
jgi:two-component system, NtrC family, nitrogen regulation response regulator GlnG